MKDKIKNNKKVMMLLLIGIVLIIAGVSIGFIKKYIDEKNEPPFVGCSYYADGGAEGYCHFYSNNEYVCNQDDGRYSYKYKYDKKNKTIIYRGSEEKILYFDEDNCNMIYEYQSGHKKTKGVGIKTSENDIDYSNFGEEIKNLKDTNISSKYVYNEHTDIPYINIDIDKKTFEYEQKDYKKEIHKYYGNIKVYKMIDNILPNYIVLDYKNLSYEHTDGFFIKDDGNLYNEDDLDNPALVKEN